MIILWILGLIVYFLPSVFAYGKPQFKPVFVLNLFLGWLIVPWVIAMMWAVK